MSKVKKIIRIPHKSEPIGHYLRKNFVDGHFTHKKLAEKMNTCQSYLTNILNGKKKISPRMAIQFEKVFGLKATQILGFQANYFIYQQKSKNIKAKAMAS
jgi:plasmid maintenance system antidote protein VapI